MTITAHAPTVTKRELAEAAMRRSWFPVARSCDLDTPQPATLLGVKLVVYRDKQGRVAVQSRRCPHRGGDLSRGEVHASSIACPYHGWEFASDGGACSGDGERGCDDCCDSRLGVLDRHRVLQTLRVRVRELGLC